MRKEKLLRISAKESYRKLRADGDIWCEALQASVKVTKLFLKHIQHTKTRSEEEIQQRLLLVPFITKIINQGKITSRRKDGSYQLIRLESEIKKGLNVALILSQKSLEPTPHLLSLFITKKKRPVLPTDGKPPSRGSGLFPTHSITSKKASQALASAFTAFLQQEKLEHSKLLLMVSGGVDSMVLLHVAQQVVKAEHLAVFHLNHNVRQAAEMDANFVQNYCSKSGIKFYAAVLKSNQNPSSVLPLKKGDEAAWRESRQNFSAKAAQAFGAARILTAHHATDLVETMIFRLVKGCGPSGLSPFDISTKPFWQVPKSQLLQYAMQHQLKWREDATNQDPTTAQRNLIRHEVLPHLRTITPNLEKVFVRESQLFAHTNNFLNTAVVSPCWGELEGGWLPAALKNKSVPLKNFLTLPPILQTELLRHIATQTPSQAEVDDCLKWLQGSPAGNSEKSVGRTKLTVSKHHICWELGTIKPLDAPDTKA